MLAGTWRYLRYIHLRDALVRIQYEVDSVGVVGAGGGIAELALAIEFPHIHFTLTDIIDDTHPRFHKAMQISWDWNIQNADFGVWDILDKTSRKFDFVCSTEVLEHIEDDDLAASRMREAALKYVYCLVPFSDRKKNQDPDLRARVLKSHGHHVFGYDAQRLETLFPDPELISGTYFDNAGQKLREEQSALNKDEIKAQMPRLIELAGKDLQSRVPKHHKEGQGIKILSRV